jgi:hypothetical protein
MLLCVQAAALGLGKIVQANQADEFVRWCRVRQSPLCAQVSAWAIATLLNLPTMTCQ